MVRLGSTLMRSARRAMYGAADRFAMRPAQCLLHILRDTRAVTSIEFAAIALPFFTLLMGTMAIGVWFFCTSAMDVAVYDAGRKIQTGKVASALSGMSPSTFATSYVCPSITVGGLPIIPCSGSNPQIAVAVVGNFTDLLTKHIVSAGPPEVDYWTLGSLNTPALCIPRAGQVVYVQATYKLPVFNAVITFFGGTPLLSGAVFQVEQTPGAPNGTCTPL